MDKKNTRKTLAGFVCILILCIIFKWNSDYVIGESKSNWLVELDKWSISGESFVAPPNYSKIVGLGLFMIRFFGLILTPLIILDWFYFRRNKNEHTRN